MVKVEFSEKEFIHMLYALESHAKQLRHDEEDPGPSMADSLFVSHMLKELEKKYLGDNGKVRPEFL